MSALKTFSIIGATKEVSVEKTRPSDTTAYAAEDVISESTSAGTTWKFADVVYSDGAGGVIVKAVVQCDDTDITPKVTLYLTNVTPTGELDDNKANTNPVYATESDNYQGRLDFPALDDLGGPSEAELVPGDPGMPKPSSAWRGLRTYMVCSSSGADRIPQRQGPNGGSH